MNVCYFIERLPYNHTNCPFITTLFFCQNVEVYFLLFVPILFLNMKTTATFRHRFKCSSVVCFSFVSLFYDSHLTIKCTNYHLLSFIVIFFTRVVKRSCWVTWVKKNQKQCLKRSSMSSMFFYGSKLCGSSSHRQRRLIHMHSWKRLCSTYKQVLKCLLVSNWTPYSSCQSIPFYRLLVEWTFR